MKPITTNLIAWLLLACAAGALAAGDDNDRSRGDKRVIATDAFLNHHPDLKYRLLGIQAYDQGRHKVALSHFRQAARYADKPAQSMLAEMLWKGEGVASDRPLAYAWMDIAAERGYPVMVAARERYWAQLDAAGRGQAVSRGAALDREFGDAAAKPRLERVLLRARRSITGSRTGFTGFLQVQVPTPGGMVTIDGAHFHADHFWKPEQYWRWQDVEWKRLEPGKVDVGPLQQVPAGQPEPRR